MRPARATGTAAGPVAAGVALVAVLALLGLGAVLPSQSVPEPAPVQVAGSSRLVCPVPEGEGATLAVAVPDASTDEVRVETLTGDPVEGLAAGAGVLSGAVEATVVLRAEGETARTLAGVVSRTTTSGADPGLSQLGCQPAASGRWLVGLSAAEDQPAAVVLTNPDDSQAVVNLSVHDEEGLRQVPGSREITVAPRSTQVVELGPLVTPTGTMAVQVQATTGRVVALGRQRSFADARPLATEWLTGSADPAEVQVLPGVPGGDGVRRLVLLNPGERRAQVQVEALGSAGAFVPAGSPAEVDVAPGGTATVELDDGFSEQGTALRVSASQPVTATLQATDADGDLAFAPATAAIEQSALGVAAAQGQQDDGQLVLSNPGAESARVLVSDLAEDGGDPSEVTIPPSASVVVSGSALGRVEVLQGQLHGSVVLTGDGLASLPLVDTGSTAATRTPDRDPRLW